MRNMGFRLAAGSVKTARCCCARRRVVFTGSAASSTIAQEEMGVSDLNKGTFLSRRKGDIFIEARHAENLPVSENLPVLLAFDLSGRISM